MKKVVLYFVLAYLISWIIWLPLILPKYGIDSLPVLPKYHHYLGSFGPMLAAFIVRYSSEGWSGVNDLLKRIVKWKVNWVWFFIVLVIPVLIVIAAGFADQLTNTQAFTMKGFSTNEEFPQFGPFGYFLFNLFTFGIGEETGWRGYALPKLQKKFSALVATLILSAGWACWHIPAFIYRPLYSQMDIAGIAGFFMSMVMGGIVLTWLYNSTKGSLLIVAIFHAMIELMFMSENITQKMTSYIGATIMIAAVLIILVAKPKNLSLVARQTLE
jgi:membrane protease YdiL (CAAX protease family)